MAATATLRVIRDKAKRLRPLCHDARGVRVLACETWAKRKIKPASTRAALIAAEKRDGLKAVWKQDGADALVTLTTIGG